MAKRARGWQEKGGWQAQRGLEGVREEDRAAAAAVVPGEDAWTPAQPNPACIGFSTSIVFVSQFLFFGNARSSSACICISIRLTGDRAMASNKRSSTTGVDGSAFVNVVDEKGYTALVSLQGWPVIARASHAQTTTCSVIGDRERSRLARDS